MSVARNIADLFSKATAISTDTEISSAIIAERTTVATLSGKTILAPAMTNIIVTPTSTTSIPVVINGISSQSGDFLNINTLTSGGTTLVKIDVNGNVGLGKTPSNKLDVNGSVAVSGNILVNTTSASGPNIEVLNTNGTNGTIAARASSGTDAGIIWAQGNTYYSGPSYTATGIVQYGSSVSGTSYGFANGGLGILSFQNTTGAVIQTNGSTSIVIATSSTERMRIDSSGNVGIGMTSAGARLQVNGSSTISGQANVSAQIGPNVTSDLLLGSITGNTPFVASQGAAPLTFNTNAVERMRIDSTGNVGIGTNNPGAKVDIYGSAQTNIGMQSGAQAKFWITAQTGINYLSIGGNGTSAPTSGAINIDGSLNSIFNGQIQSIRANNAADGSGQIYLNGATGNRIDFGGSGIAAPAFTTRSAGTKIVLFPNVAATTADYAIGIESANIWQSVPNSTAGFKWYAGQTNIGTLSGTGTFTVTGNVTAYSDERLKSNIKTIENALNKVSQLRGVSFDKDGENGIGVIAQEVQKVLPEVVQDGEYLSVAYGNIVGLLIEAVKEQQNQIEDLKSRLA